MWRKLSFEWRTKSVGAAAGGRWPQLRGRLVL
jgi:hypothetical protein